LETQKAVLAPRAMPQGLRRLGSTMGAQSERSEVRRETLKRVGATGMEAGGGGSGAISRWAV